MYTRIRVDRFTYRGRARVASRASPGFALVAPSLAAPGGAGRASRGALVVGAVFLFLAGSLLSPGVFGLGARAGAGARLAVGGSVASAAYSVAPPAGSGGPVGAVAGVTVPVGRFPSAVVYDGRDGYVYVANRFSDTVSVLFGSRVVSTVPVGVEPWAMVYDSGTGDVYVSNDMSSNVSVISGTNVVTTKYVGGPDALAYDSRNGYVYVASQINRSVDVISGVSVIASLPLVAMPNGVTYDNFNGYVYVSEYSTSELVAISGTSILATIEVGVQNQYDSTMTCNTTTGDLYVPNPGSNNMSVISGTSVIATVPVGSEPMLASYDQLNGLLYVSNAGSQNISVVSGLEVVASVAVASNPNLLAVSNSTGTVYVDSYFGAHGNESGFNLSLISGASLLAPRIALGSGATSAAYDDADQDLYIANGNNVTVVGQAITSFSSTPSAFPLGESTFLNVSTLGGVPPYSYIYNGLPSGCRSVNRSSLLCTPGVNGTFDVTVTVTDQNNMTASSNVSLLVTVLSIETFTATPAAVQLGASTDLTVNATGGIPPYSYSYTGLPQGCSSANVSSLRCTPAKSGSFPITVRITSHLGGANATATLEVLPGPMASIAPSRSGVDAGELMDFVTNVSGGAPPYSYSYTTSQAGAGCASSGGPVLNCTPTAGGFSFDVQVEVTDFYGNVWNAISTAVTVYPAIQVNLTVSSPTPMLAQTVAFTVNASGGSPPYNYTYLGLPFGCYSENRSSIGCLPTQAQWYNITAVVRDSNGVSVRATVTMHVIFDFNVIIPKNTPVGQQLTIMVNTNETFNVSALGAGATLVPDGGYGSFTYVYSGLPPGCANANVEVLTCTPTQVGKYAVTVSVHDQVGDHQTHAVLLNVVPAAGTQSWLSPTNGYYVAGAILGVIMLAVLLVRSARNDKGGTTEQAGIKDQGEAPQSSNEPPPKRFPILKEGELDPAGDLF